MNQASLVHQRIMSVDALRGFDMFWIVGGHGLVTALAGAFYDPVPEWLQYHLKHPAWIGFSGWDLIMPLFLFIVGTAMPFSFTRRNDEGQDRGQLYWKIIRRTLILFVLGMAHQGSLLEFDLSKLHIYCNTLQAIACGYLIAGVVMLNVAVTGQAIVVIVLLVGYWLLLILVPVPGLGPGALQPDANVALTVDEFILGSYRDGTTYTWILSSLGFGATVLLGVLSGHLLRSGQRPMLKVAWLVAAGFACLAGGWFWAQWLGLPIIKHVWSSSMVLWAAGWSYLLLALFYGVIDVAGIRAWAFPFVVIGMNAITAYLGARFIPFGTISSNLFGGLARLFPSPWHNVVLALTTLLLLWLALYHMYRRKIFLRI